MSEVDITGRVLSTFTDVGCPYHLSTDSEDHAFVADYLNHRILLLNSKLQLERVLVDTNSQVKLQRPRRLYYNELTSQLGLHVVHDVQRGVHGYGFNQSISRLSLRWVMSFLSNTSHSYHAHWYLTTFICIAIVIFRDSNSFYLQFTFLCYGSTYSKPWTKSQEFEKLYK